MGVRIFTAAILVVVLTLILSGWLYYDYSWTLLRFPFGIGVAIVVLCIADLLVTRRAEKAPAADGPDPEPAAGGRLATGEALRGILWVMAAFPAVYLLGYVFGLPLYILVAVRVRGHGWGLSLATALGGLAVVYLGFIVGLRVPLPLLPFEL